MICGVGTEIRLPATAGPLAAWPHDREGWCPEKLRTWFARRFPEIHSQPEDAQTTYKLSYFAHGLSGEELEEIEAAVAGEGFRVRIIYSSARDLDLLPAGVDKGSSAAFVAKKLGIEANRVIVSGDSGNDLALFCQSFRGIVVANAHPELKALREPRIYHAQRTFAAGVLEGLRHWEQVDRGGGSAA